MDDITLTDGRNIRIDELRQFGTYSGLLAGLPDAEMSSRLIERLLENARELGAGDPYLISPRVRRREVQRGEEIRTEERLPPVACAACFTSGEIAGSNEPYSLLVVAWFQERFGDIDDSVKECLVAVDWDRRATPWCP